MEMLADLQEQVDFFHSKLLALEDRDLKELREEYLIKLEYSINKIEKITGKKYAHKIVE